jgi:hypothetical protein
VDCGKLFRLVANTLSRCVTIQVVTVQGSAKDVHVRPVEALSAARNHGLRLDLPGLDESRDHATTVTIVEAQFCGGLGKAQKIRVVERAIHDVSPTGSSSLPVPENWIIGQTNLVVNPLFGILPILF